MARLYDSADWRSQSRAFLKAHPWCVMCAERSIRTRSSIVDHRTPHRGNTQLFWDKSNWQGLCRTCHSGAKQSLEKSGRARGCDEDGNPLDPNHRWNRGRAQH